MYVTTSIGAVRDQFSRLDVIIDKDQDINALLQDGKLLRAKISSKMMRSYHRTDR